MKEKSLSKDFTSGNVAKQLLWFAIPFMASNAFQVLYSTIDMIIVGKYVGTAGLSAVSQSSLILNFATMVCLGFSNGGQVMVAQALGAKKRKEMNEIIGTLFSLILMIALILSSVFLIFRTWILEVMNIPSESYDMTMDYFVICGLGLIFTAGYNMVSAVLRGMGDSKRPFIFIGIASVINLVLDILFSLYFLYKNKEAFGFDFKRESFRIKKKYVKMIMELGTPMAIQSGCINLSMLFVNSMVNKVGMVASATFGVGVRIDDIINKISQGIQYAAMPMISQNIAAKQQDRTKKVVYYTWLYSAILTIIFMLSYIGCGKQLFMMFSDDVRVHEMSDTFIKAILWMFPAMAIMRGSNAFVQGIGNAKLSMALSLLDGVVLRIGLSGLFGVVLEWGFFGFVLGYGLAPYGCGVPGLLYFLSGRWKKRKLLAEEI